MPRFSLFVVEGGHLRKSKPPHYFGWRNPAHAVAGHIIHRRAELEKELKELVDTACDLDFPGLLKRGDIEAAIEELRRGPDHG